MVGIARAIANSLFGKAQTEGLKVSAPIRLAGWIGR
jgi:hypothetical protein